jgi:hypothetical protein
VIGGIFLVLLAAGARLGMADRGFFAIARQNIDPSVISAVIVYFFCGLVLISQGQLAVLRSRWTLDKVPANNAILRTWPWYVFALIAVIGVLSSLLPFGGTFRLSQVLSTLIAFIYVVVFAIFRLLSLLFFFLFSLLPGGSGEEIPREMPRFQPPPIVETTEPPSEVFQYVGGALFWVMTALLLGYAAYIYFSGKGMHIGWLKRFWQMLKTRWQQVWHSYREWQTTRIGPEEEVTTSGTHGWRRRLWSRFRQGNLDPDQQVRYYYLSALEQAEESGIGRTSSETPLRYGPRLAGAIDDDDARQGIRDLTDAFVRVRYASQPTASSTLPHLKQIWHRLLDGLKRRTT